MAEQIIAVDMDDVLLPHFQDLINWYNQQYGTHLTLEHNHPADPSPWGVDDATVAIKRVHKFFETPMFLHAKPFDEAVNVLESLKDKFQLFVITSRDTMIERVTRDWLEQHFPKVFQDIHFTSFYSLKGERRSKAKVAESIKTAYMIEDDLIHAKEAANLGIQVLLFGEYPWNKLDKMPPNMHRVKDWAAVQEFFDE